MGKLNEITDENFKKEVLSSSKPYCVTYSALSFCAPCKILHKTLTDEVVNHPIANEVNFGAVATEDKGVNISSAAGIRSVPTTIIYKGGEPVAQKIGAVPAQVFISWVKESIV